LITKLTLV